ncbi:MAG: NAD(P)-binding domain-containing protein [Pseudomonadales bacterium]|nr:NAD(P)-binding domain-containing protein [Pseudomonadales bacterium]
MTRRVAIIGAGAAGLVTAREMVRAGHRPTVFEQSRRIGGVWVYSPDTEADPLGQHGQRIHSSLYASLRTNLPRDLMAFVDFPFDSPADAPDEWPRFPGHACVLAYLEAFARHHRLSRLIRFGTRVIRIEPVGASWRVLTATDHAQVEDQFDAIAICNGHYSEPRIPATPGAAGFPGRCLHSHNYREPAPFAGRRVALFGASASAMDLSREIAGVADTVWCCGDAFAALPPNRRTSGVLERVPGIASLEPDGRLVLTDGASIGPVDDLIYCTGYRYHYPFLDERIVEVVDNHVAPLYREILHARHSTLGFIGIPFRVVPFPLFEQQATWFARLLAGHFALPAEADRLAEIARRVDTLAASGVRRRHFHQRSIDCYDYLDELSRQCGSPPIPDWHRALNAAFMAHAAAHPGDYRYRPLPHFGPTRVPAASVAAADADTQSNAR